jgi:hypothetical protein
MAREIPLTKGLVALVDDDDFDWLSQYQWRPLGSPDRSRGVVAVAVIDGVRVRMHRLILGVGPNEQVDHFNHETLDNRRANLRACNAQQNACNRRLRLDSKTGYKGVFPCRGRFRSVITVNREPITLGTFDRAIEGAVAYDRAAIRQHGAFAKLNFSADRDWIFPFGTAA